jgi:hypothetical protein
MNAAQTPAPFPLTLEKLFFTKTIVIAIHGHEAEGGVISSPPEHSVHVARAPDNDKAYVVTARTVVNPTKSPVDPYHIDMECVAILIADDTLQDAQAARGAAITGHNVTMGAIRETVSWITGRHPYGALMLGLSVLTPKPTVAPPADE